MGGSVGHVGTRLQWRHQQMIYRRLSDHLSDIETKNYKLRKYIPRGVCFLIFCCLVSALVCSLAVEPTNRQRLLRLRIWQWVTMAIMIFAIFSIVPVSTLLLSYPFKVAFRTRKYWIYFLRRLKRSVDVTLWSCLVLLGWYSWFRPRLNHVSGDVSDIACKQITRFLIAFCIGAALWALKTALFLKLKADLHYDHLFDRIRQTVHYLNGYELLKSKGGEQVADFLAYDEGMIGDFTNYENEEKKMRKTWLWMRYVVMRKWKLWSRCGERDAEKKGRGIWADMTEMKRESVPIWILVRLAREYTNRVKVMRQKYREFDGLEVNDDHRLLESAKKMFMDSITQQQDDIDQFDEIDEDQLRKYGLSEEVLDYLFSLEQHQQGEESRRPSAPPAQISNNTQPPSPKKANRSLHVDDFLQWAVRVHKNCWGLERTLESSKKAFHKLNRMLTVFLLVLMAIIWLLLSKIVNTGQLAVLFAPFLAASFMFENSSKNMLNGIIFAFAMHPFDVGDRVIIEGTQMCVKELHILTSVFYKYDTGAEVVFPNSKLATTKIVNLDITPDQSDQLGFVIRSTKPSPPEGAASNPSKPPTPLENIKDLELKIQKFLDDDIYYALGTKVVKNCIQKDENPLELHMTVHFKYLVSYLTEDKKAERRSEILSVIMKFLKEMETEDNMKEYPHGYVPYDVEFTTEKKVKLSGIERLRRQLLARVGKNCKVLLANIENKGVRMGVYVTESSGDATGKLKSLLSQGFLREHGCTETMVLRGDKILYQGKLDDKQEENINGIQGRRLDARVSQVLA